jgi:hypothetical protein
MKIKEQLAKLLATENITVRHDVTASTASFDVKDRVLTLPIWSTMAIDDSLQGVVYDLMVGHEVGHALWTPMEGWHDAINNQGVNQNILNICEDPRIEKFVKRRYPGLRKSFSQGYMALMRAGFFGEMNYESLTVLDRLNIHFKGGVQAGVPFEDNEMWMVDGIEACETFDDVVEITKKIQMAYADLLEQMQEAATCRGMFAEEMEDSDEEGEYPTPTLKDGGEIDTGNFDQDDDHVDGDYEAGTVTKWENSKQVLAGNEKNAEITYFGLPKPILKNLIIPHKEVREVLGKHVSHWIELQQAENERYKRGSDDWIDDASLNKKFHNFRGSTQKIVNYMVKEFERKKAADEYKRTSIDKTGILNVSKLHEYKYSDDLFLKRAIVHDGKNHGLIFLLDWSASMHYLMHNTMKQLLSLIWFCNKVGIPYEVYGFSNSWYAESEVDGHKSRDHAREMLPCWEHKHDDIYFGNNDSFRLLNLLSSRMSAKQLNEQCRNLFVTSWSMEKYRRNIYLGGLEMGSTPLVEAMVAMQEIIPNFRDHYKLDKVNFICLTDGEANTSFNGQYDAYATPDDNGLTKHYKPMRSRRFSNNRLIFDDPKSRKTYEVSGHKHQKMWRYDGEDQSEFLIKLLKVRNDINAIGIFLESGNTVGRRTMEKYLGWYTFAKDLHKKVRRQGRVDGFITIKTSGFDEYYILPTGKTIIKDEYGLPLEDGEASDMSKGKLKNIFAKNQKSKFGNRVMVNRMIDLIV